MQTHIPGSTVRPGPGQRGQPRGEVMGVMDGGSCAHGRVRADSESGDHREATGTMDNANADVGIVDDVNGDESCCN